MNNGTTRRQEAEDTSRQQPPLLTPKLQAPRLHSTLLRRERLLLLLDKARERKLTLIAAPAGFGKTTLARQWIAAHDGDPDFPPVAWVLLDAGDNDPVRFWRYVVTACETFQPDLGRVVLPLLEAAPQPFKQSPLEIALTSMLNELTRYPNSGLLVLEDYHLIDNTQIHDAVSFLLAHLPDSLRVMIITRSTPPLPLAQLRASGELGEVQASDLRFSAAEALAFLQQTNQGEVSAALLAPVEARLEGWAAGLRVLSLALEGARDQREVEQVFAQFAGSNRSLQEYFIVEVLNTQPEEQQSFCCKPAFCPR